MGKVLQFPPIPDRFPSNRPGLRKSNGPWRAVDLKGRPPKGHQSPKYTPLGKVEIALKQVWVEGHTQDLYVVVKLIRMRKSFYPHDIVFVPYGRRRYERRLAEATFRLTMTVWDKFEAERKKLNEKVCRLAETDPGSPWQGDPDAGEYALNFFGLDSDGYRID
jgi:hypothetical protein